MLLVFLISFPGMIPTYLNMRTPIPIVYVLLGYLYICLAMPVTSIAAGYTYRTLLSQMAEEGTLDAV